MSTYNPFDNQLFREEFEKTLDRKLGPLVERVDDHERYINEQRGGGRVLHFIVTVIIAGISGFLSRWFFGATK